MIKYTTFYIVRHGETIWNRQRRMQGQQDSPLTKKGLEQIREIAKRFKNIHFDAIFSSDLLRAKQTAEIIALEKKLTIITTKALRERSFGKYEGKPAEIYNKELRHIFERLEKLSDKERFHHKLANDIESDSEIVGRYITFLRELAVAYEDKTLLIVSHGSVMRVLLVHLGFGTYEDLDPKRVRINNTAYIILESDGIDFFIKKVEGLVKPTS